jgi:hypothetical protein
MLPPVDSFRSSPVFSALAPPTFRPRGPFVSPASVEVFEGVFADVFLSDRVLVERVAMGEGEKEQGAEGDDQ